MPGQKKHGLIEFFTFIYYVYDYQNYYIPKHDSMPHAGYDNMFEPMTFNQGTADKIGIQAP